MHPQVRTTDDSGLRLDSDLLDERRARAEELPLSLAWFRRQRLLKTGPPFLKISTRIFYERRALRRWIQEQQERRVH